MDIKNMSIIDLVKEYGEYYAEVEIGDQYNRRTDGSFSLDLYETRYNNCKKECEEILDEIQRRLDEHRTI